MRKFRIQGLFALVVVFALVGGACASEETTSSVAGTGSETTSTEPDLLARIQEEGVIRVSTDPAYPPASSLVEGTQDEYEGFDIDVAEEIAKRLGVTVEWVTPEWTAITSGGWSDRWDMSVGSMTVLPPRAEVLYFTVPYYYAPAGVAVNANNSTINAFDPDLDGTTIGVCGGCTYDFYLQKTLSAPGVTYDFVIDDATINTYNTDTTALQDLYLERVDAVISGMGILQGAIDKGKPIRLVADGAVLFYEANAVAFDKSADPSSESLSEAVNQIIQDMHEDGTMSTLSEQWWGEDLTSLA